MACVNNLDRYLKTSARKNNYFILQQEYIRKFMAFVFSNPRWLPLDDSDTPGPGSYFDDAQSCDKTSRNASPKIKKGIVASKGQDNQDELGELTNFIQTISRTNLKLSRNEIIPPKKSRDIKTCADKENIKIKNLMEVSSLTHKSTNRNGSGPKTKTQEIERPPFINDFRILRTPPSIQQPMTDNFYIGAKAKRNTGQFNQSKNNTSGSICRGSLAVRPKSVLEKRISTQDECQRVNQLLNFPIKRKMSKPFSAKHPMRKRNDLISGKGDSICINDGPTGISGDDDEDSEFIQDANPGPGQYNPKNSQLSTKKGYMFTENKNRFEGYKREPCRTDFYERYQPKIKKFSRASQKKIGFGRSIGDETQKEKEIMRAQETFYQNFETIQHKAMKNQISNAIKPGFFNAKQARFPIQTVIVNDIRVKPLDVKEELKRENELDRKISANLIKSRKTPCFKSNNPRRSQKMSDAEHSTKNVEYWAQRHNTVQEDLIKQQQQLEITEDFNIAFNTTQNRFRQGKKQEDRAVKQFKTDVEIKHQLVQDFHGFRKRKSSNDQNKPISYSFSKLQRSGEPIIQQTTDRDQMEQLSKLNPWIKQTFNKNFIIQQGEENNKNK